MARRQEKFAVGIDVVRKHSLNTASAAAPSEDLIPTRNGDQGHQRIATIAIASALCFGLYFPYFLNEVGILRMYMVAVGILILFVESARRGRSAQSWPLLVLACGAVLVGYRLSLWLGVQFDDNDVSLNLQRFGIVLPIYLMVGRSIWNSKRLSIYLTTIVVWSAGVSALAILEVQRRRSLFGRDEVFSSLFRDGQIRALLATEHALVLGTILAATIPFVWKTKLRFRLGISLLLLAGTYATGSLGPICIAAAAVVIRPNGKAAKWLAKQSKKLRFGLLLFFSVFAYFCVAVWEPVIYGASGREYSTGYRSAMYSFLPETLLEKPIGFGIGSIPQGIWTFYSASHGSRDVSNTVDSELFHLALLFGIPGVLLFAYALFLAIRCLRTDRALGISLFSVTGAGFFLSLHSWDTLGPFWYLLAGAAFAVTRGSVESGCSTKRTK